MLETIIVILLIMFIIIYKLKYKSSSIALVAFDHKTYLVNDLPDSQKAADTLAKIMLILGKLLDLIIYDKNENMKHSYDEYIKKIKLKLPNVKISETPIDSQYTSYSINKGEELVLCIRDKSTRQIHNINELLYVAIHEIAHIGCPEIGHTDLFKDFNLFLLEKAVCYKLYKYIDYAKYNKNYCGITLTSSILSDNLRCM
jgi:predicted metal-dependent hydrolase